MDLKRKQETLTFDDLTVTLETAGRLGSWHRDDYRTEARQFVFGDEVPDWSDMDRDQRYRFMLHLHEGAALAGGLVSIKNGDEETDTLTPEMFEQMPDVIAERLLAVAYRLNPHWMPSWAQEADQGEDPKATPNG